MIKVTRGSIESALRQSTILEGSRTDGLDFDFDYALQPKYTIPRFFYSLYVVVAQYQY